MKKLLLLILLVLNIGNAQAQFTITGINAEEKPTPDTGLEKIYLFKTLIGSTVSYKTKSANSMSIYSYEHNQSDKVVIPASDITTTPIGSTEVMYTVSNLQDNRGLIFVDNNQSKSIWIIDYSAHKPQLNTLSVIESEDKCENIKLYLDKKDLLEYRGTNGTVKHLRREYTLSYNKLTWDNKEETFVETPYISEPFDEIDIVLESPNMDTRFTIKGDQYGEKLGMESKIISDKYRAIRVEGYISAKQKRREAINEIGSEEELGGSAPVEIEFFGYANEPTANFFAWFIHNTDDKKNPIARYSDRDIEYTFSEAGNYYLLLEVADASSTCIDTTRIEINVSESSLEAPNFFSPRNQDGINDEFKVAYKSIVKFKCTIVNRWGNKIYEWTDPAKGWDGRHNGKMVNPGIYYYVIEATGSDNKKYKLAGDINIL